MEVTMLYFDTISALIKEHGYTWDDVEAIEDNNSRVKFGDNNEYTGSLREMFRCSHMGCNGSWNGYTWKQNIIDAFLEALKETKTA